MQNSVTKAVKRLEHFSPDSRYTKLQQDKRKKTIITVETKIADCRYSLSRSERRMNTMKKDYQASLKVIALNEQLSQRKDKQDSKSNRLGLNARNEKMNRKIFKNDSINQELLQLKINILKAQLDLYEKFLKGIQKIK
jgi:hypothetical protein